MTTKNENVRDFLSTRRAKITPEMAGLPRGGNLRRVPGLRREEVALLSGISVDYYTRIEKGDLSGVSDEILDAMARTLQLNDDEIAYLYDLARTSKRPARIRQQSKSPDTLPLQIQLLMDSMAHLPVIALNRRLDILGSNALGRALFTKAYDSPTRKSVASVPNLASFVFLDPAAGSFYADLEDASRTCVQVLRAKAGATPYDRQLAQLIGELSTRSEEFGRLWAAHDVGLHRTGRKVVTHHEVGELNLGYEELTLDSAPSMVLSVYIAEPGSATAERLKLLDALATTNQAIS